MHRRNEARAAIALALVLNAAGCGKDQSAPAPTPPAHVANARKESELTTVTLTEKAETRLGVKLAQVERRRIGGQRTFGGEVTVPKGRSIVVSAPVAGTVAQPAPIPAGATVRKGQLVLRLVVLPSAAELSSAGVRVEAARKRAERAARLVETGAGSQRQLEEARAELELAEAAGRAASPGAGGGLPIASPQAGMIRELLVGPGQSVAAGAPLFQVDAVETLWVRVPIYVGELAELDPARGARVRGVSATSGVEALPVAAPPSADPLASTSDLTFQLASASFRPGQRVEVDVPVRGEQESLVLPWSAVVHDINGGTWVYEKQAARVYSRRRVEVKQVIGPWAVLGRGPAPGTSVVVAGAAEIFGTEFGAGK